MRLWDIAALYWLVIQYISGWLFERNREQWGNRDKVY